MASVYVVGLLSTQTALEERTMGDGEPSEWLELLKFMSPPTQTLKTSNWF